MEKSVQKLKITTGNPFVHKQIVQLVEQYQAGLKEVLIKFGDANQYPRLAKIIMNEVIAFQLLDYSDYDVKKTIDVAQRYILLRKKFECLHVQPKDLDIVKDCKVLFFFKPSQGNNPTALFKVKNTRLDIGPPHRLKFIFNFFDDIMELMIERFKYFTQIENTRISLIWDREGFKKEQNYDDNFQQTIDPHRELIQSVFASFIQNIFVLQMNWFFKVVFSLIQPFINQKNRDKIQLIRNTQEIYSFYQKQNLLKEHGGEVESYDDNYDSTLQSMYYFMK